jgi:acylpyruvate hydrolase
MRLVNWRDAQTSGAGRLEGDHLVELPFRGLEEALASATIEELGELPGPVRDRAAVHLDPVVRQPGKIICLGLNYVGHILERHAEQPRYPTLFAKFADCLIGAYDDVTLWPASKEWDHEVELAVVIGKPIRSADTKQAVAAIAGFTILNDISARDWQRRTTQFLAGKVFEASCPVGPHLVTRDEVANPGRPELAMSLSVDGEIRQVGNTREMIFSVAETVAYISQILTLAPGDLIATGTPAGVAESRTPPAYLRPGQIVRSEIEGLGFQENRCV